MEVFIEVPELTDLMSNRSSSAEGSNSSESQFVTIRSINFAEGDEIQKGDIFALVTNKYGSIDVEAPANGVITEICREEDDIVSAGEIVAVLDTED